MLYLLYGFGIDELSVVAAGHWWTGIFIDPAALVLTSVEKARIRFGIPPNAKAVQFNDIVVVGHAVAAAASDPYFFAAL